MSDRFDDLVGQVENPRERERLQRVHELLLSVEAPPKLSPMLLTPPAPASEPIRLVPRRRTFALLAAALAAAAFGAGWLGGTRSDDVAPEREIAMRGVGEIRGSFATIELLPQDSSGNWPLKVSLRGLEPSRDRKDFYELWLTKDGKLAALCGRFTINAGPTTVTFSVPYGLKRYDGWVVTRRGSDRVLLTT